MNPLLVIKAIQTIMGKLPEELKMAVDSEIDKLEDKFKQGSIKDTAMEYAMKVLRETVNLPDYPDEDTDEDKSDTPS